MKKYTANHKDVYDAIKSGRWQEFVKMYEVDLVSLCIGVDRALSEGLRIPYVFKEMLDKAVEKVLEEGGDFLLDLDADDSIRAIVITGNDRAFAAGADIKQMAGKTAIDMLKIDQFTTWDTIRKTKKPLIAAVSGFALGGGCELVVLS